MRRQRTLLSINNYHYPRAGAEMVYMNHNRLWADGGWQVVPFAMKHPLNLPDAWDRYFVDEIELGSRYSLSEKLRRIPRVVYSLEARAKLQSLLRACEPNVAHIHNIYHHISPSILSLLKARDIPTVMTLHDLKIACPAYKMLTHDGICERCRGNRHRNLIRHRCIKGSLALSTLVYVETKVHSALRSYPRNVSRFIAPSRFFMQKMIEWGLPAESLVHVPNCIPFSHYAPARKARDYFAYVGRLAPEKGVATLIRAAAQASVPLRIIGSGPEERRLKVLADECDVEVSFTGHLSGAALRGALEGARALVLPSEWYENAPISVLEAYRDGLPVIGAAIGGLPEMVVDRVTGRTFTSGSIDELAACLIALAECSSAELRAMGDAGRKRLEDEYSEPRYYARISDVYARLGVTPESFPL